MASNMRLEEEYEAQFILDDERAAATKVAPGVTAKCAHKNRECTYESDDGEFERWRCKDCGERWGVEIAQ